MLDIAFAKPALPKSGALVLPLFEGEAPAGQAAALDAAAGGALARAIEGAGFTGRKGQSAVVYAPVPGLTRVVVAGLGQREGFKAEEAGGALVPHLAKEREATVLAEGLSGAEAAQLAMGALLRAWRFDRYRTTEKPEDKPKLAKLTLAGPDAGGAKTAFAALKPVAEGVFLARELVSEPANILTPAEMAERCKALAKLGVEVEVLGPKEMRKLGFGAAVLPRRVARGQKPPAPIEGLTLDEIGHLADLVAPFAAQTVRKKEKGAPA